MKNIFVKICAVLVMLAVHAVTATAGIEARSDPCRTRTVLHAMLETDCSESEIGVIYSKISNEKMRLPEQFVNFGYSTGCLWILATVRPAASVDSCWFEVGSSFLNQIRVYGKSGEDVFLPLTEIGDEKPFQDRLIRHRNFIFPYQTSMKPQDFLFQVRSESTLSFPIRLGLAHELSERYFVDYIIAGFFYGAMIFFAIYGLWAYVVLRKFSFLLYGAFAASIALFFCAKDGFGFQFFWSDEIWWQSHGVRIVALMSAALGVAYAGSFLRYRLSIVAWPRALATTYWLVICTSLVMVCTKPLSETHTLVIILSSLSPVLMATLAFFSDGIRSFVGRCILLSSLVSFCGVLVYSLSVNRIIPSSAFTEYAMQGASIIEFMIIASAIARHISDIRLEGLRSEIEKSKAVYRSEMMENLAHDLKNPLAIFEFITRSQTWEEFLGWRHDLDRAVERIHGIIANFSKDYALAPLKRSACVLNLQEIANEATNVANSSNVKITADSALDAATINIDRVAVERALFNLIKNATEAGAVNIQLAATIHDLDVFLEVRDNGPGVAPAVENDLFQRGKSYGKDGGQGIGLYNVRRTAEEHGGTAEYVRENGTTIFRMSLPHAVIVREPEISALPPILGILDQPKPQSVVVSIQDIGRKDALLTALANYPIKIHAEAIDGVRPSLVFTDDHYLMDRCLTLGIPILMENGKEDPEKVARQIARRVQGQFLKRIGIESAGAREH